MIGTGCSHRAGAPAPSLLLSVLMAGAVAAATSCGAHGTPRLTGIVVITLDTTRADRLSPYGYMNVSLPAIERLAVEGIVFDRASSVAPLTLPAHTTLFTGLLPPRHGVRDNADTPLGGAVPTLAELLGAQGFRTGAFVGSAVLASDRGLARGFDTYTEPVETPDAAEGRQRRGDEVVDDALAWLEEVGASPFFLWTHLFDPHRPYDPPEPYGSQYAHNPYVGEIAFADAQVGRLLEALERSGRIDETLIVLAGDHGESLGAHGERDHGIFLYEDVIRVPLVMRLPELPARRVSAVVRLTDVMPTVLDWLAIQSPTIDGVSLRPLMTGAASSLDLEAYAESRYPERFGWSPLYAVHDGRFKFIDAPRPELYDLQDDPFEARNIYALRPSAATAMAARLAVLSAGPRDLPGGEGRIDPDPALRDRLAALGYVGTPIRPTGAGDARGPDPKDCIWLLDAGGGTAPASVAACR